MKENPPQGDFSATFPNRESPPVTKRRFNGHLKFTMALKKSQRPVTGCLPEGLSPPPWTSQELSFLLEGGVSCLSFSRFLASGRLHLPGSPISPKTLLKSSKGAGKATPSKPGEAANGGHAIAETEEACGKAICSGARNHPLPQLASPESLLRGEDCAWGKRRHPRRTVQKQQRLWLQQIPKFFHCKSPAVLNPLPPPFPLGELHPIQAVSCHCWSKTSILSPLLLSRGTVPASLHSGNQQARTPPRVAFKVISHNPQGCRKECREKQRETLD